MWLWPSDFFVRGWILYRNMYKSPLHARTYELCRAWRIISCQCKKTSATSASIQSWATRVVDYDSDPHEGSPRNQLITNRNQNATCVAFTYAGCKMLQFRDEKEMPSPPPPALHLRTENIRVSFSGGSRIKEIVS